MIVLVLFSKISWDDYLKLLVSPRSLEEAQAAILGNADIIDVKNPAEGSLGANFPWIIRDIVKLVKQHQNIETSAAIGDVPNLPGTVSLAALGLASLGIDYVKIGLFGPDSGEKVAFLLKNAVRAIREFHSNIKIVAVGYADYLKLGTSINPLELPSIAAEAGCDVVMVDTGIKDGTSLLTLWEWSDIERFIDAGKTSGLQTALAGSLKIEDCLALKKLAPDIIGVRSAVCENFDRNVGNIQEKLVEYLKACLLS